MQQAMARYLGFANCISKWNRVVGREVGEWWGLGGGGVQVQRSW